MEKKRILVVDDEPDLCEILAYNLASAGYDATVAHSAEEALLQVHCTELPDLLLLDVMMPGMSGFDFARQLKGDASTACIPIIFLTAKDAEDDMLHGFRLGADDYVRKPFSVREVVARVQAVLSRAAAGEPERVGELCYRGLTVDTDRKTASVDGAEAALTKTEFELLTLLLANRSQVLSRQQLLSGAWPSDVIVTGRTVDVNIARMRKKIGIYGQCIVARPGYGYVFEDL
jgi:DNA-binding response OmpR family regulator